MSQTDKSESQESVGGMMGGGHGRDTSPREAERQAKVYAKARENFPRFRSILTALDVKNKRKILAALASRSGTLTYAELEEFVPVSRRNLKKHVSHLDNQDVLDVDGNPASVSFADQDMVLLVTDVLEWFEQNEQP